MSPVGYALAPLKLFHDLSPEATLQIHFPVAAVAVLTAVVAVPWVLHAFVKTVIVPLS